MLNSIKIPTYREVVFLSVEVLPLHGSFTGRTLNKYNILLGLYYFLNM